MSQMVMLSPGATRFMQRPGWYTGAALGLYDETHPDVAGLGNFLKKIHRAVTKVAVAPLKLVAPKLADKITDLDEKVIKAVDKVHDNVTHFVRKNAKWIIIAAAIAITIYTMGTGAGIAAKMISGAQALGHMLATAATTVGKAVVSKWSIAKAAIGKLVAGRTFGSLNQQEVGALATVNQETGQQVVPPEVLAQFSAVDPGQAIPPGYVEAMPETSAFATGGYPYAPASGGSSVMPFALGGGLLLALLL